MTDKEKEPPIDEDDDSTPIEAYWFRGINGLIRVIVGAHNHLANTRDPLQLSLNEINRATRAWVTLTLRIPKMTVGQARTALTLSNMMLGEVSRLEMAIATRFSKGELTVQEIHFLMDAREALAELKSAIHGFQRALREFVGPEMFKKLSEEAAKLAEKWKDLSGSGPIVALPDDLPER